MNASTLKQLFAKARQETPPPLEPGFENLVLGAIRRNGRAAPPTELAWLDQITAWSPRLAIGCASLIVACIITELALNASGLPTLTEAAAQISGAWLLTDNFI